MTKQELQDRLEAAEIHIEGLQNELTQQAFLVESNNELRSQVNQFQESTGHFASLYFDGLDKRGELLESVYDEVEALAELVQSLSEMQAYTFGIAVSILAYGGDDANRYRALARNITEEENIKRVVGNISMFSADVILAEVIENIGGLEDSEEDEFSCGPDCTCQDDEVIDVEESFGEGEE